MTDLPLLTLPEEKPGVLTLPGATALMPPPSATLTVPGERTDVILPDEMLPGERAAFCVTFAGRSCASLTELAQALADAWDEARGALLSGALARLLDGIDLSAAAFCREAAAAVAQGVFTPDRGVLEVIRRLGGEDMVLWRGRRYASVSDLGGSLLQALRGTGVIPGHFDSLMRSGAAGVFIDETRRPGLQAMEARYAAEDCTHREKMLLAYMTGYLLSGVAALVLEEETFYTVEELGAWLEKRASRSRAAFTRVCHRLLDEDHLLDPQLEAWLTALGCRQQVSRWQAEIDAGML